MSPMRAPNRNPTVKAVGSKDSGCQLRAHAQKACYASKKTPIYVALSAMSEGYGRSSHRPSSLALPYARHRNEGGIKQFGVGDIDARICVQTPESGPYARACGCGSLQTSAPPAQNPVRPLATDGQLTGHAWPVHGCAAHYVILKIPMGRDNGMPPRPGFT